MNEKNNYLVDGKGKIIAHDVKGVLLDGKGHVKARMIESSNRTVNDKGEVTGQGDQRLREIKPS